MSIVNRSRVAGRTLVMAGLSMVAAGAFAGCGESKCNCASPDVYWSDLSADPGDAVLQDVPADPTVDTVADAPEDVAADVPADSPFDVEVATTPGGLPMSLPFVYERPDVGTPLTDAEVTAFTKRITGFWKQVDYFTWAAETSAGMDVTTGKPDYLIWWHDFAAVKAGDTVTFRANAADGGSHNNAVPTGVVLTSALSGYLLSGDASMKYIVEQYTKSITACMKGFVFDDTDTVDWLMARNITGTNHDFTLPSGKKKRVEYDQWHFGYTGWNADRFEYPNNPTWGDIWVTNKRSKDDLPYWYRLGAWMPYVIELSKDASVRDAAAEAYRLLQRSARDIVESGWKIRTKDADGTIFIPPTEDLASFVAYTEMIPDAECDARLSTALLGYGDTRDVDCGSGQGSVYDDIAGTGNYFNYNIITYFHQAAILLALTTGHPVEARAMLEGLATRLLRYRDPMSGEAGLKVDSFQRENAVWLMRGAVVGLPLTSEEARIVQKFHDQSVTRYATFPNWNLWDPSVPDGTYSFRDGFHPGYNPDSIQIEDLATLLEYCWSPFKNPAGAKFVDCDIVNDPAKWGVE